MKKSKKLVLPLLVAALALTGCGSSSGSASKSTGNVETASMNKGFGYTLNSVARDGVKEASVEEASVDTYTEGTDTAPNALGTLNNAKPQADAGDKSESKRKLIRTKTITVETKDLDKSMEIVNTALDTFEAYIESSTMDSPTYEGGHRTCYLTIRVPQDNLDAFTTQVDVAGTVTNASENTEDVTLQYTDVTAHKKALETEYNKVMELLEQAKTMDQILLLESKLSDLHYQIDSYESQIRVLDDEVTYSTVSLTLREVEYEKDTNTSLGTRIANGFKDGMHILKEFSEDFLVMSVTVLPSLLVVGFVIALIIAIVKVILRRTKNYRLRKNAERAQALYNGAPPMGINPNGKDMVFGGMSTPTDSKGTKPKDTEGNEGK